MLIRLLFVFNGLVIVKSLNQALVGQSVLYGISHLAKENANFSTCLEQLAHFYDAVEDHQTWALKALDASGSPGSGFFYGNNLWLGSYAQCEDLSNTKPFEISYESVRRPNATLYDFPPFNLGFAVAYFEHNSTLQHHTQLPLEFTIQLGLCIPQTCSTHDLHPLLENYVNQRSLTAQNLYNLNLNLTMIRSLEPTGLWLLQLPKTIIFLSLVSTVLILTIIGTCYDVRKHKLAKNLITGHRGNLTGKQSSSVELVSNSSSEVETIGTFGAILKCFSMYSNVKNLVKTDLPPESVTVIHGLKFFGMLWVIMVHAVFYQSDYLSNVPTAYRLSEDIFAQILSNSTYSVDTYLFLSGFLLAYLFFKSRANHDSVLRKVSQFFMMFLNRFLRLTPPYVFVILMTDVMYTYYRKASVLYSSERNEELCPKYWWRNLLYINNLYPRSEMCLSWSWYLSVDTQFFTVVSFLLILSTSKFKISAALTVLLIIGNVLATTYKSYTIRYIPTMDEQLTELDAIYDLPWNRIGPYLIGVVTAYIYVIKLKQKLVLKERTRIILWTLFPLLNLWILFTLYTRNLSVEFSAVYMGVSRTLWGIGLGWLIIACSTGNARALEKFLSFRGWIPLSRLTYCAYLLNPLLANMIYMGSNSSLNASKASFGVTTQGVAMTTYFLAFFMSVLIESPSILLTKMMFNKLVKSRNANAA
ncbi:nose resistant to fluoxetine protein 6 [Tribolium castaneum]|uniref:Nose resistant to fluoxetine protein 6-like Protein n=1 Tax=Tribolium castaneum TaxID=7070 RepID=D6WB46_TRICA|nr:PREDICTED: nose resistant to fluoxetine protein 6 isoform X2 [Tribolium castaneum]EEZ98971.2 Nose resistant to fluoxetine protein 6-like Protein [Tribolium castaneum]|eukprot:XP_008200826.1 PREDICTED: nose resistant to fluoxetine protein 6 isoform X2 [Tribolium castaneum]